MHLMIIIQLCYIVLWLFSHYKWAKIEKVVKVTEKFYVILRDFYSQSSNESLGPYLFGKFEYLNF